MHLHLDLPTLGGTDVPVRRDGRTVATFDLSGMKERTSFEVDGVAYRAEAAPADGVLVLTNTATGLPEAQSLPVGWSGTDRDIEASMPGGAVHRIRFDHTDGADSRIDLNVGGRQVGHLRRATSFERTVEAELPDAWPLPLCVFLCWLAARQFSSEDAGVVAALVVVGL